MVEYQHPAGAGCLGDEAYGFRIIDAAQLVLVIEVLDRTAVRGRTFILDGKSVVKSQLGPPMTLGNAAARPRPVLFRHTRTTRRQWLTGPSIGHAA
jgi:hypothetical protein